MNRYPLIALTRSRLAVILTLSLLIFLVPVFSSDGRPDAAPGSPANSPSAQVFEQLDRLFLNYQVLELDLEQISEEVKSSGRFTLEVDGVEYELLLQLNNLRSPTIRWTRTTADGVIEEPLPPVSTYKGAVVSDPDSQVRLLIRPDLLVGYIRTRDDWLFIEPLYTFAPGAPSDHVVVYRESDVRPESLGVCGVTALEIRAHELLKEKPLLNSQTQAVTTLRTLEIATDADGEFFQIHGANSNSYIEGILNGVDGIYQTDLDLTLQITFENVFSNPNTDPYSSSNSSTLLDQFRTEWNRNRASVGRDVAHLFTGRNLNGGVIGIAFVGVVCNRPVAYGLTADFTTDSSLVIKVVAHEVGHNLNALHDDEVTPPAAVCDGTGPIMCSFIQFSGPNQFSQRSITDISDYTNTFGSCLAAVTTQCDLSPAAATNFVGSNHTVTVTVTDGGGPVSGATVDFAVTAGPNVGTGGTGTTDANGQASFTYTGSMTPGTDSIEASGSVNGDAFVCSATKEWVSAVDCSLTPPTAVNPAGTSHTVTATVTNMGTPAAGVSVTFSVLSGPNAGTSDIQTTDASGQASFTYTSGGAAGTDTIQASGSINGDAFSCTATKTWVVQDSITLLSPNGGESWPVGSVQTIRWTSSGITGKVRVQLSRNGGRRFRAIFRSVPNTGSVQWTVSGSTTTQALIRVLSLNDRTIRDTSDGNFTIGNQPPPTPTITVTSPNGGEDWMIGSLKTIQWTSSNLSGNVKIELSRDGGTTFETLFATVANSGSRSWTVTGAATTQAIVRISSVSDSTVSDTSDGLFSISGSATPSVTVTAPNGGEDWMIGSLKTIQWTSSNLSGNVKIELSRDGGTTFETLFATVANSGSRSWTVTGAATTQAIVRISSVSDSTVSDTSDGLFSISEPPSGPSITVIAPNGGESWPIGSIQTIRWTSTGITGNVRIQLSRNGGARFRRIFRRVPNTGSIQWTVTGPASSRCLIRVLSLSNRSVRDVSDTTFSITP